MSASSLLQSASVSGVYNKGNTVMKIKMAMFRGATLQ
jgi:hypothetical protein